MARRSNLETLVDQVEASALARERAKVILRTLAGRCSVQSGCRQLGVGRTRLQDLRRRLLEAGVRVLEERPAGRPRSRVGRTCRQLATLRRRLSEVERELWRAQTELDIARSEAGPAVVARRAAKELRR